MQKKPFKPKDFMMNYALYLIMLLIVIIIACISPKFISLRVIRDILTQSSTKMLVALGCMFIIV